MNPLSARQEMLRHSIIPPSEGTDGPLKHTCLVVSSRDRDASLFPSPSQYVTALPDQIDEVTSVSLRAAWFPFSAYQVNSTNSTLRLQVGSAPSQLVRLDCADYDGVGLAAALSNALNAGQAAPIAVVAEVPSMQKLTLRNVGTDTLVLSFRSADGATAGRVLGFQEAAYTLPPGRTLVTDYRHDLDYYNRYVVLEVDSMDALVSANNTIHRTFAILYRHRMEAGLSPDGQKSFKQPEAKMAKIGIRVLDRDGNLYDAQNQDHILEFTVSHHSSTRRNW
jgi:hypothetical protein